MMKHVVLLTFFGVLCASGDQDYLSDHIKSWRDTLGEELNQLSLTVTKSKELTQIYERSSAKVSTVDGDELLDQIVDNLEKLVKKKVDAVQRLAIKAEEIAEEFEFKPKTACNFTYKSLKLGTIETLNCSTKNYSYEPLELHADRHFLNTEVNTDFSGVHVPTNVYDRYLKVAEDIQWSRDLDETFVENYEEDPSLLFQYFGSTSGILRLYPAMRWRQPEFDQIEVDLYDCRTRPWFIQSATCSKDVIILMDNSGSMTGMRNTIAKLVVQKLLDTFGINDLINVFQFNWLPSPVLPCFNNTLVPGTQENINLLKDAVADISPDGNASFPHAFEYALDMLSSYRERRGCNASLDCNQAIMLVTDSLPGNITEVFERLNVVNDTRPVRVFTYLLGIEVRGVREIQDIACSNRGYYVHIHTLDEVSDQVLKYIPVIARPLVLQSEQHPVSWTHAFADVEDPKLSTWLWDVMSNEEQQVRLKQHLELKKSIYFSEYREDENYVQSIEQFMEENEQVFYQEYNLLTSVSVPVFDKKQYKSRKADLLGVVGIDVPIDEFRSLTFPYKIGVNGYAFIVTNNGYLLLHPDLRPVFKGVVKKNFHSVDLAEVEFIDEDEEDREYDEQIIELRNSMAHGEEGQLSDINVKFHVDGLKRILTESRNYYFKPLPHTSFTVGLALPSDYGNYQITVRDELRKDLAANFFTASNWSIHPKWTYCKYFHSSAHYFPSPEEELMHFLENKISEAGFKWNSRFDENNEIPANGGSAEADKDSYYCDKELMQLLMFDAKVTQTVFESNKIGKNANEMDVLKKYNPSLRFLATQSGLTRWQEIPNESSDSVFGQIYNKAIEEAWYKTAVVQWKVDKDSFTFSVPFDCGLEEDIQVRATKAVFPKNNGLEAPALVTGLEFSYEALKERFSEITANFPEAIDSTSFTIYLLDHNGYVIISDQENDTGTFFGKVNKKAMEQLEDDGIYRQVTIYDYQGLCMSVEETPGNSADIILTPFKLLHRTFQWILGDLLWTSLRHFFQQVYFSELTYANPVNADYDDDSKEDYENEDGITDYESKQKGEKWDMTKFVGPKVYRKIWPCDRKHFLYLLNQHNVTNDVYTNAETSDEEQLTYYAARVNHTNLIIIAVIDNNPDYEMMEVEKEKSEGEIEECHRISLNDLPRRRLSGCFTHHPLEEEIVACGNGVKTKLTATLAIMLILLLGLL